MTDELFSRFRRELAAMPIVAILRGVRPEEAVDVGHAIVEAGIKLLEVPLNSPEPLKSISKLSQALGGDALVGAGTVYEADQVNAVSDAGGRMIVSPNTDPEVIRRALARGLLSLPGCFTPTECNLALRSGAHALKLFPGELVTAASAKAISAVLPKETLLLLVGGVSAANIATWRGTSIAGFGIGSGIYQPGDSAKIVNDKARALVAALRI